MFSVFPIVKLATNCAKIYNVGRFEEGFEQVPLVKIFWNDHSIVIHQ